MKLEPVIAAAALRALVAKADRVDGLPASIIAAALGPELEAARSALKPSKRRHNLTGKRFGKLTAVEVEAGVWGGAKRSVWKCVCECGTVTTAAASILSAGKKRSCGCSRREPRPTRQGVRVSSERRRRCSCIPCLTAEIKAIGVKSPGHAAREVA